MQQLSAHSAIYGVIGDPISHSRSPQIHNAAFEALGIDAVSVGFCVKDGTLDRAIPGLVTLGVRGVSVTMPHKEGVLRFASECTEVARVLGAANCLTFRDGGIVASNTDGAGFIAALHHAAIDPTGMRCAVLGAGGAARAVILALKGAGVRDVVVINRSVGRARSAAALAHDRGRVGVLDDVVGADLIVNATPAGMEGTQAANSDPLGGQPLASTQVVCDLVYNPLETALLQRARAAGAVGIGGLSMLVHQAAIQLATWTGSAAPTEVLMAAAGSIGGSW